MEVNSVLSHSNDNYVEQASTPGGRDEWMHESFFSRYVCKKGKLITIMPPNIWL